LPRSRSFKSQPLHEWVRLTIQERIADGTYLAAKPLPAVLTLSAHLGVSAITVRRALSDLKQSGVLRTVPGLGTFVNTNRRFLRHIYRGRDPLYGTLDDARQLGRNAAIVPRGIEVRRPHAPDFPVFAIANVKHFCLKRVVLIDGEPIAFEHSFITFPIEQDLLDEFSGDFIYRVLRKRKVPIAQTNMYFDAAPATAEVARELGIPEGYSTIRHFYNPVLRKSEMRIYGVSVSPFDRLGFVIHQPV
jgi:GntR family transcriptional regulator